MRTSRLLAVLSIAAATLAAAEDAEATPAAEPASKRASTLAPVVNYLDVWTHLHTKDVGAPKVMLLLDGEDKAAPDWFSTAAMKFKDGRKKTAAFLAVTPGADAKRAAVRFGLQEVPEGGAVFACVFDDKGGNFATQFELKTGSSNGEKTRAMRSWVETLLSSTLPEEDRMALPAFPEPTRPRKKADVSLEEFTHETLSLNCYGVKAKPLCVLAILDAKVGEGCPSEVVDLAKRHANDPISFGCVGASKQTDFLSGYKLDAGELPALLGVKPGRRNRFTKHAGAWTTAAMSDFVSNIIGGGASFKKLEELPELEAPYLLSEEPEKEEL